MIFKPIEFDGFKTEVMLIAFTMSPPNFYT